MWRRAPALAFAVLAAGCADLPRFNLWPAPEESPQEKPDVESIRSELASVRERNTSLEGQVSEFSRQVDTLSAAVRSLQKQNSDLQATVERLERERLMRSSFPAPGTATRTRRPPGARRAAPQRRRPPSITPRQLYNESYRAVRDGQNEEAIIGFRRFLRLFPKNRLAPNSQYWLAEAYYDLKEYPAALDEFQNVISRYPKSRKAPDAYYKLGLTHLRRKRPLDAKRAFERLLEKFPRHPLSQKARLQIQNLDSSAKKKR